MASTVLRRSCSVNLDGAEAFPVGALHPKIPGTRKSKMMSKGIDFLYME
jgi:hypothetical protein